MKVTFSDVEKKDLVSRGGGGARSRQPTPCTCCFPFASKVPSPQTFEAAFTADGGTRSVFRAGPVGPGGEQESSSEASPAESA